MNILIKETGELRSLSFIDWHDGQEYTEQLISASGEDPNFLFDQDGEVFMTDASTPLFFHPRHLPLSRNCMDRQ